MPVPILPIALGLASIAGTAFNASRQERGAQRQNRSNERLAREQRTWNERMWERQNVYNDPQAQMQRFTNAGLNPNLIYGQGVSGAAGNAGAVQGYNKAEAENVSRGYSGFADIAQIANTSQQTSNLKAQEDNVKADTVNKAIEAINKTTEGERSKFDLDLLKELRETSVDAAKADTERKIQEAAGATIETRIKSKTEQIRINNASKQLQIAAETLNGKQLENKIIKLQKEWRERGIIDSDSSYMRMLIQSPETLQLLMNKLPNKEDALQWITKFYYGGF